MDLTEQSPVILSLCPGIRGLERGLERIFRSVRVAAYVEIETFIVENLLSAMETGMVDAAPIWTNLKTFNPEPFRNRIDGIIGGYPCQPFSLAGNRGGVEDPRHLYPYISKSIKAIRPTWCFFENVRGHLSMGYPEVYRDLRDMGYRVEPGIYSAEEAGAPHQRDRLFILAIMEDPTFFGERRRDNADTQRNGCQDQAHGSIGSLENSDVYGSGRINQGGLQSKVIGTDTDLGHSSGVYERNERNQPAGSERSDRRSGIELANSDCRRCKQCEQTGRCLREFNQGCCKMADTSNDGQDGSQNRQGTSQGKGRDQTRTDKLFKSERFGSSGNNDRFPSGQGAFQHDWEEPRTIESSVEYTINGYNFTEDLHRAIGNSVVEQTAELAFRDLIRKHFPNP